MDDAEGLAKEAGALGMGLHVYTGNEVAIRFYERRGYEFRSVERGFYGSEGGEVMDALVYFKRL